MNIRSFPWIAVLLFSVAGYGESAPTSAKTLRRVFIVDHDHYESHAEGIAVADSNSAGANYTQHGGVRMVHTEQAKTFSKECPEYIVTVKQDAADFVIVWDNKESSDTKWGSHENEFTIYSKSGDMIGSGATHRMSSAARDICRALAKDQRSEK